MSGFSGAILTLKMLSITAVDNILICFFFFVFFFSEKIRLEISC